MEGPESTYNQVPFWREYCDPIEDPQEFERLRIALQNHIWNMLEDYEEGV